MMQLENTWTEAEPVEGLHEATRLREESGRPDWRPDPAGAVGSREYLDRIQELKQRFALVRSDPFAGLPLMERGQRSERALAVAVGEMVLAGAASRRIQTVVDRLCGPVLVPGMVEDTARQLDAEIDPWRTRPIGGIQAVFLGTLCEPVRVGMQPMPCTVLMAMGIREDGRRTALGASASIVGGETQWRGFLQSLSGRGLVSSSLVVGEDWAGFREARADVWPEVPWQRCQLELCGRAQELAAGKAGCTKLAADIRYVFRTADRATAEERLGRLVDAYGPAHPDLARWMACHLPEGFVAMDLPPPVPRRLRTGYMADALRRQVRRRTRAATLFPSETALLRLVCAVLMEVSEDWEAGQSYLRLNA